MKKIITFPPFIFFTIMVLNIPLFFMFPRYRIIPFPYNLSGLVAIWIGYYIVNVSSKLFHKEDTTFRLDKPSSFIQTRFYKISRNPMYLGALIFFLGLAVLTGNLIALIGPILFFLCMNYLCIPPEEVLMERTFGNPYVQYKKKVRRWL